MRRVLIVDDDHDFADTLARLLRLECYDARPSYGMAAALEELERFPADVALVDIRLAEGSGLDLLSTLRECRPDLISVMMTAYGSTDTAIQALKNGAYDYLRKPFRSEHLLATLEQCFDRIALTRRGERAKAALRQRNRELEALNRRLEQTARDLALSEERLRNVIDNSPSAISLKDLDGRFVIVNRRFEDWHGHASGEVTGKAPTDLFPDDIARRFEAQFREVLENRSVVERETVMPFADGARHTVLVTGFPVLDAAGQPSGVGTITTDVTASRQAEEQLRQAQKTEVLGQLTGGIAHDFNNLLAVISGNLDLLKDEVPADPGVRELLDDALSAAASGAELTHRLLAFGRRQTLHPRVTDASALITAMARMIERTLGETIEIRWALREAPWPVEVDRNHLETSLLNLAINARDAMPDGGVLTIGTANVNLEQSVVLTNDTVAPGEYVVVSVADTGVGMSPDVAARAIEPFFTTKGPGHGSGLGLSMVYGFVRQSGGHLEITSGAGQGTTVQLYLRRALSGESDAADTSTRPPATAGTGERILVVEDMPDVRRLTRRVLTRLGYEVIEAADARAALACLDEGPGMDLLFTDIVLPGGTSGIALAREAMARHPTLKVLYTSGYANSETLRRDLADGEMHVIRKPVAKEKLARTIRRVLRGAPPEADSR